MIRSTLHVKPNDLLRIGMDLWEVQGVHLGGTEQESAIHVRRLNHTPPAAYGKYVESMVPELMLRVLLETRNATLYAYTQPTGAAPSGSAHLPATHTSPQGER